MKYPFIKQKDMKECGPLSLLMIIRYYDGNISLLDLKDMLKTDKKGTTAYDMIKTAKELGFDAYAVKEKLLDKKEIILPLIAHVIKDCKYLHYVVIYKIDYKKKKILVADSSDEIKWWTFDYFESVSTDVFIFLRPNKKIVNYQQTSIIDLLYEFISKNKSIILYILFMTFISTLMMMFSSYLFQVLMSLIDLDNYSRKIVIVFVTFTNMYFIKALSDYYKMRILIYLDKKIDYELVTTTFKNIINLPYTYFYNHTTGEIVSKINDLDIIKKFIVKIILTLFVDFFFSTLTLIALFIISDKLFIITIFNIIFYILIALLFTRIISRKLTKLYEKKVEYSSYLVDVLANYETLKGLNIKDFALSNFRIKQSEMLNVNEELEIIYSKQVFYKELISSIFNLITMSLGFYLVVNSELSLGLLITYNTLYINFISPLKDLLELNIIIKESKIVLSRIESFSIKEEVLNSKINIKGNIKIDKLSYSIKEKEILKDINLNIKLGSKVLLTGNSGTGKSTLLKIISKHIKEKGIYLDGIDYSIINNEDITKNIAYVSQNSKLFNDSIINNILLDSKIDSNILDIFEIEKVVSNKDLGYHFLIEEEGNNISGGEKQRIVLARTFLKKRKVYLLDEVFNELDIKSEENILNNLFKHFSKETIILVSHRNLNSKLFDRVLRLENGALYDV
jgi:ATP-binding cassette, subfamily C, bacteriocin exporter